MSLVRSTGLRKSAPVVAPAASYLVRDSFTDSDGTLITAHTPEVGGGWAVVNTTGLAPVTPDIQNGELRFRQDSDGLIFDAATPDVKVEMDWVTAVGALNRNSILFRYLDSDRHWIFNIRVPNQDVGLLELAPGVAVEHVRLPFAWIEGQTYRVAIIMRGQSPTCYVDGVEVGNFENATAYQTATRHGILRNTGSDQTRVDNVSITPAI